VVRILGALPALKGVPFFERAEKRIEWKSSGNKGAGAISQKPTREGDWLPMGECNSSGMLSSGEKLSKKTGKRVERVKGKKQGRCNNFKKWLSSR